MAINNYSGVRTSHFNSIIHYASMQNHINNSHFRVCLLKVFEHHIIVYIYISNLTLLSYD